MNMMTTLPEVTTSTTVNPYLSGVWPIGLSLSQRSFWVGNYFDDIMARDDLTADWNSFSDTWNDLEQDQFMADGGRYRRRRFSEFVYDNSAGTVTPLRHAPFFQSSDHQLSPSPHHC